MSSRNRRGFFFAKAGAGKEIFVPKTEINRFFQEWVFPGHDKAIVQKCAASVAESVSSYNPRKERVCFVVDGENYLNSFLSPLESESVTLTEYAEYIPFIYGKTEITPEDWQ